MQISFVNYKTVSKNKDFRIDAEYYKPIYFKIADILNTRFEKLECIECICDAITNGHTPYHHDLSKGNIKLITAEFIDDFTVLETDKFILEEDHRNYLKRSILKNGDIIFAIKGKIGHATPIFDIEEDININQDIARLSVKKEYNIFYVSTFLNCKYGRLQAEKESTGQINPFLGLNNLKNIKILFFEIYFQKLIEKIIKKAHYLRRSSNDKYSQAEQILLSELNLLNWKPKRQLSFVKNFSDAQSSNRIDAEYFQPMYEDIIEELLKYENGYVFLGDEVSINDKNFAPKDEVDYKYIELANISANGDITGFIEALGNELPTRARRKVNTGDVIVSSIEGSLSSIALINDSLNNALCSTGFYVVNSNKINSETLLVFLKSNAGQLQLKKGCSGTILMAISKDKLAKLIIPKVTDKIQCKIKTKITEMYNAKALSNDLLDIAKRGVELAIEKDEQQAKMWMDSELKKLNIK